MEIDMSGSEGHDFIRRQCPEEAHALPLLSDKNSSLEIESFDNKRMRMYELTSEQRSNDINKFHSLAMAYVVDQIRGPLPSVQTLTKMLSLRINRSEISYDIIEDIIVRKVIVLEIPFKSFRMLRSY